METKMNVRVHDNGAAFCVTVNGMITSAHNTLGGAWRQIAWMHAIASQEFTVGSSEKPVREWISDMQKNGVLKQGAYWEA